MHRLSVQGFPVVGVVVPEAERLPDDLHVDGRPVVREHDDGEKGKPSRCAIPAPNVGRRALPETR
jgi:hypothetical protein